MLDQVLSFFGIIPDFDLNVMTPGQDLTSLTGRILEKVGAVLDRARPDAVLVHGDTTTTFAAALAAYYRRIPIGHVEAGLRTDDKYRPYPEELNRRLTGSLADIHFAPTYRAKMNLIKENVPPDDILVTGNTVIDALKYAVRSIERRPFRFVRYGMEFAALDGLERTARVVLITGHRRENFGQGLENVCSAVSDLARLWPDVHFVYPVHLNPRVREPVFRAIGGRSNIHLLPPLEYEPFVALMTRSHLVLTDSGGIQEEAPSLGKPVIVTREVTERPEAVEAGTVRLAGTDREKIFHEVDTLLRDDAEYEKMSFSHNPYGDGLASRRIVDHLMNGSGLAPHSSVKIEDRRLISPG